MPGLFPPLSPLQQARRDCASAAAYSDEITLGYAIKGMMRFVALLWVVVPALIMLWHWATRGLGNPLDSVRAVLYSPLLPLLAILLVGATLFYVFAATFLWAITYRREAREHAQALDEHGVIALGVVVDRWDETYSTENSNVTMFYLTYRYGSCVLKQQVSEATYNKTVLGSDVRVRCLSNAPMIARLEDAH